MFHRYNFEEGILRIYLRSFYLNTIVLYTLRAFIDETNILHGYLGIYFFTNRKFYSFGVYIVTIAIFVI